MERKLVKDGLTEQEQLAFNTIAELMTHVNTDEFSEEAKENFMSMMREDIGLQCAHAMKHRWVLTEEEANYLIGALAILVRSKTNA